MVGYWHIIAKLIVQWGYIYDETPYSDVYGTEFSLNFSTSFSAYSTYSLIMTARDKGDIVTCNASTGSSAAYHILDRLMSIKAETYYNEVFWFAIGT